jgi:hypothetical protein
VSVLAGSQVKRLAYQAAPGGARLHPAATAPASSCSTACLSASTDSGPLGGQPSGSDSLTAVRSLAPPLLATMQKREPPPGAWCHSISAVHASAGSGGAAALAAPGGRCASGADRSRLAWGGHAPVRLARQPIHANTVISALTTARPAVSRRRTPQAPSSLAVGGDRQTVRARDSCAVVRRAPTSGAASSGYPRDSSTADGLAPWIRATAAEGAVASIVRTQRLATKLHLPGPQAMGSTLVGPVVRVGEGSPETDATLPPPRPAGPVAAWRCPRWL